VRTTRPGAMSALLTALAAALISLLAAPPAQARGVSSGDPATVSRTGSAGPPSGRAAVAAWSYAAALAGHRALPAPSALSSAAPAEAALASAVPAEAAPSGTATVTLAAPAGAGTRAAPGTPAPTALPSGTPAAAAPAGTAGTAGAVAAAPPAPVGGTPGTVPGASSPAAAASAGPGAAPAAVTRPDPAGGPGTVAREPTSAGSAALWIPVAAVAAALGLGMWARRRRRTAPLPRRAAPAVAIAGPPPRTHRQPIPLTPLPELDAQARHLLIATDDAVRTSEEELGQAAGQLGDKAAAPYAEAVQYAKGELTAAFRLRQKLDDGDTGDDDTRRELLDEILSRCTQANRRLDAESAGFDRLRALETNAALVLERAEAAAAALPGRIAAAEQALAWLGRTYAGSATGPVAGHPAEARDRLEFARSSLGQARAAVDGDPARAAVFVRAAESAVAQAAALAESVTRRQRELRAADRALGAALAGTATDLAHARELAAAGRHGATALEGRIARAETVLADVRQEVAAGRHDPMAALRRVEEADEALGAALAADRHPEEAEAHTRVLLDQALLTAHSEVAAARDVVTTHRGAIGSRARTRLTEAERLLRRAESAAVIAPGDALEDAATADRLARQAQEYARHDVSGFGDVGAGTGRRTAGMGGMGGAVLGGILLGDLLTGGSQGAGTEAGAPGVGTARGPDRRGRGDGADRGHGDDPGDGSSDGDGGYGGFGSLGGGFGGAPGTFGGDETRGRMGAARRG
jgi:hypothetical protein